MKSVVTFNVGFKMAEQRMDLEAAGALLGKHPNSIRARAKKEKIRSETDNTGKIWVFLDPDTVANNQPSMKPSKRAVEPTMKVTTQTLISALEGHIVTLKGENEGLKSALADALRRLDLSEEERRKLVDALMEKSAAPAPPAVVEPARRRWWQLGRANG